MIIVDEYVFGIPSTLALFSLNLNIGAAGLVAHTEPGRSLTSKRKKEVLGTFSQITPSIYISAETVSESKITQD